MHRDVDCGKIISKKGNGKKTGLGFLYLLLGFLN